MKLSEGSVEKILLIKYLKVDSVRISMQFRMNKTNKKSLYQNSTKKKINF